MSDRRLQSSSTARKAEAHVAWRAVIGWNLKARAKSRTSEIEKVDRSRYPTAKLFTPLPPHFFSVPALAATLSRCRKPASHPSAVFDYALYRLYHIPLV